MKHLDNLKKYGARLFQKRAAPILRLNHPDLSSPFQGYRQKVLGQGEKVLNGIREDMRRGERDQLEARLEQLYGTYDLLELVDEAIRLSKQTQGKSCSALPHYLISSWFLSDCLSFLTSNPHGHERMHLVTGIKLSQSDRTLDRMVKVTHAIQTDTYARADHQNLSTALIELDERWGHSLHGIFHSHPGKGESATQFSSTDLNTHRRYEHGGFPLIGAIFVKDGFVRFFSENTPFTVTIYGRGVVPIDKHHYVYKITL
jgi:hypothetical protein